MGGRRGLGPQLGLDAQEIGTDAGCEGLEPGPHPPRGELRQREFEYLAALVTVGHEGVVEDAPATGVGLGRHILEQELGLAHAPGRKQGQRMAQAAVEGHQDGVGQRVAREMPVIILGHGARLLYVCLC
jgi:hypothetical protein